MDEKMKSALTEAMQSVMANKSLQAQMFDMSMKSLDNLSEEQKKELGAKMREFDDK